MFRTHPCILTALVLHGFLIAANPHPALAQTVPQIAKKTFGSTVLLIMEDANGQPRMIDRGFHVLRNGMDSNLNEERTMADPGEQKTPPDGNYTVQMNELVTYITRQATAGAQEKIEKHVDKYLKIVIGVVTGSAAILGMFLLYLIQAQSNLRKDFSSLARTTFLQEAPGVIKEKTAPLERKLAFITLSRLAQELRGREGGFSNAERDSAMEQLKEAAEVKDLMESAAFKDVLEKLIDVFASANLDAHIDKIDDIAGKSLQDSAGIVITLVQHYGERLAGSIKEPGEWPEATVARFKKYAEAAKKNNIPEVSLAVQLLVGYQRSGKVRTPELERLLHSPTYWTPKVRTLFLTQMVKYSDPLYWMRHPTQQGEIIAETCCSFWREFKKELEEQIDDEEVKAAMGDWVNRVELLGEGHFANALSVAVKTSTIRCGDIGAPSDNQAPAP